MMIGDLAEFRRRRGKDKKPRNRRTATDIGLIGGSAIATGLASRTAINRVVDGELGPQLKRTGPGRKGMGFNRYRKSRGAFRNEKARVFLKENLEDIKYDNKRYKAMRGLSARYGASLVTRPGITTGLTSAAIGLGAYGAYRGANALRRNQK